MHVENVLFALECVFSRIASGCNNDELAGLLMPNTKQERASLGREKSFVFGRLAKHLSNMGANLDLIDIVKDSLCPPSCEEYKNSHEGVDECNCSAGMFVRTNVQGTR